MKAADKTPIDLARETGLARESIYRYVQHRVDPHLSALPKLAEQLGVAPSELVPELGVPPTSPDYGRRKVAGGEGADLAAEGGG